MAPADQSMWTQAVIEQNQRWLRAYLLTMTGDPTAADDLVQEVFAEALKSQERYDSARPFGAWLRGIARNHLHLYYRRSRLAPQALDDQVIDRLDHTAQASEGRQLDADYQEARVDALRHCLAQLSQRLREMLSLKYGENQSSREIGVRIQRSAETVDVNISRARQALMTCISLRLREAVGE